MNVRSRARIAWGLLRATVAEWLEDKAPRLAAALAYYTIFALAPVLVIATGVAGLFLDGVEEEALAQVQAVVGPQAAEAVRAMLLGRSPREAGLLAALLGTATLLVAATGLCAQLQDALNTVWEVEPKPSQGILGTLRNRLFSFAMVLGIGFLLLVSMLLSALIATLGQTLGGVATAPGWLWQGIDVVLSFAVVTGLFALIFKVVPDAEVDWRDVWIGALASSLLFIAGKQLISRYLATEAVASAYGAAGALVLLLLWIYYSAQILLFGAEFTQVYARHRGGTVRPSPNAVRVGQAARAQQGIPSASPDR